MSCNQNCNQGRDCDCSTSPAGIRWSVVLGALVDNAMQNKACILLIARYNNNINHPNRRSNKMTKTRKLYEVREFIGNYYSKQIGRRLRERKDALRIVRLLKKQGREVFASPMSIAA